MPELTPRVGIKKPLGTDNVTRQSFNENWDIIDAKMATVTDLSAHQNDAAKHVTAAERTAWNAKAGTQEATTSASGLMSSADKTKLNGVAANANNYTHPANHAASMITVADAGNVFTGTNVETVLTELFTNANNGKTAVANAVTAKGVAASPSDTFAVLANKVGQINTGKKWASGFTQFDQTGDFNRNREKTIRNLNFRPGLIVITARGTSARYSVVYNTNFGRNNGIIYPDSISSSTLSTSAAFTIYDDGFSIFIEGVTAFDEGADYVVYE